MSLVVVASTPLLEPAKQILGQSLKFAGIEHTDVQLKTLQHELSPAKLTITLGDAAARLVLGSLAPDDDVRAFRGYLWDAPCGRVLTTVDPTSIVKEWTPWRALLNLDMRRAAQELRDGCPPLTKREVHIVTSVGNLDGLRAGIAETQRTLSADNTATRLSVGHQNIVVIDESRRRMCVSRLSSRELCGAIAVDIENTGDLKLACVGFAPNASEAWVIPACEGWQLEAIKELCESSAPKVLQNGQYDRFFTKRFAGFEIRNQVFDTMLAWHVLQPELAGKKLQTSARKRVYSRTTVKSLKFLSSIYTRDSWWKVYGGSEDEQMVLCGRDCAVTLDIALKQARQLEAA